MQAGHRSQMIDSGCQVITIAEHSGQVTLNSLFVSVFISTMHARNKFN
jgi:hypothetical protein